MSDAMTDILDEQEWDEWLIIIRRLHCLNYTKLALKVSKVAVSNVSCKMRQYAMITAENLEAVLH